MPAKWGQYNDLLLHTSRNKLKKGWSGCRLLHFTFHLGSCACPYLPWQFTPALFVCPKKALCMCHTIASSSLINVCPLSDGTAASSVEPSGNRLWCCVHSCGFCLQLESIWTCLWAVVLCFTYMLSFSTHHTHTHPHAHIHTCTLRKLVIGGDDIVPDKVEQREDCAEYTFTWFTNGYTTTQKGRRHDLKFSFLFDNTELAVSFQVKFYPVQDSTHLTWGTKIQRIELGAKGQAGAVGFQTLSPTNVTFKWLEANCIQTSSLLFIFTQLLASLQVYFCVWLTHSFVEQFLLLELSYQLYLKSLFDSDIIY